MEFHCYKVEPEDEVSLVDAYYPGDLVNYPTEGEAIADIHNPISFDIYAGKALTCDVPSSNAMGSFHDVDLSGMLMAITCPVDMDQTPPAAIVYDVKPLAGFGPVLENHARHLNTDNGLYPKVSAANNCSPGKSCGKTSRKGKNHVLKGQWTVEEDRTLTKLVEEYGERKWSFIAQKLDGRVGKQCRERWHNHLRPNIKKDSWSEEEDRILIQAHTEVGNKWAEIAKRLSGRTENSIKNHWNATKRRQLARRRSRNSKNPRSSSLLQEYIKGLNIANTPPTATTATERATSTTGNCHQNLTATNASTSTEEYGAPALHLQYRDNSDDLPPVLVYGLDDVHYFLLDDLIIHESDDAELPTFSEPATGDDVGLPEETSMMLGESKSAELLVQCDNVKTEVDLVEMFARGGGCYCSSSGSSF